MVAAFPAIRGASHDLAFLHEMAELQGRKIGRDPVEIVLAKHQDAFGKNVVIKFNAPGIAS